MIKLNHKISVVVPVYNGEKTLGQCLEAIFAQSLRPKEIIVVDNNSNDSTKWTKQLNLRTSAGSF